MAVASGAFFLALLGAAVWLQATLGASLLPHSFCITASPSLLWLHVSADSLIALAYFSIPLSLLYFVRKRRDIPFGWLAMLFGAFIVSCGTTHPLDVWTLWEPVYWYSGTMKAVTAVASIGTAAVLIRYMPVLISLPSAGQLREVNEALEREVETRRATETQLLATQAQLQRVVASATARAQEASTVLDRFFDMAHLGLVVLDERLRFVRTNPAMSRGDGVSAADHTGMDVRAVMPDIDPLALATVESVLATRQPQQDVEVRGRTADGRERHFLLHAFPIELPARPAMVGGIVQDITYQRKVERERAAAQAAAQEASRQKDHFLAKVSHELRSPLQVALSSTEALKRMPEMSDRALKVAQRLSHSVTHQARMISDLLDVSRILNGKLHMEPQLIDPAQPLLDALDHWHAQAAQRDMRLDASGLQAGLARVEVDPARLEQIYTNLLDNAMRFSEPGGVITLACEVTPGHRWRLSVCDEGAGMARSELNAVFEPFAQGSSQPATGKGLGLGLAIVRSLAEAFNARVWAESGGLGRGSTFFLEFAPADAADVTTPEGAVPGDDAVRLDGLRILYVEDEPDVVSAMVEGLTSAGAVVSVAHDAAQALEQLQGQRFDALVSDLNLGAGPSGIELLKAARLLPTAADLPAIAVSAFGSTEDKRDTRRAGFVAHWSSP